MPDITVGRDQTDLNRFGPKKGTGYIGNHIVGEKRETHFGNPVHIDLARPHVIGVMGKRGSGKCVTPDTLVKLGDGRVKPIEDVFTEYTQAPGDADETVETPETPFTVQSLAPDLSTTTQNVQALYRKHVDEDLMRIQTSQGREITVTQEHPLLTAEREWVEAGDLTEDMFLALPRSTSADAQREIPLNVPNSFENAQFTTVNKRRYELLKTLQAEEDAVRVAAAADGSGSFHRLAQDMADDGLVTVTGSPLTATITEKGQAVLDEASTGVETWYRAGKAQPITVPHTLDRDVARFLAYLTAEGHEQKTSAANYRILFTNQDTDVMQDFKQLTRELFGLEPRHMDDTTVYVNSRMIEQFLTANGYTTGVSSREKTIPQCVMQSPPHVKHAFLQTFFECEGSPTSNVVELSTASKDIADKLCYLLHECGVFAKHETKRKYAANTESQTKRTYHVLTISNAANLAQFQEQIGFQSQRKQEKLAAMIGDANPNIDTVPHAGELVKQVRTQLGMPRSSLKKHKQSVKAYEEGKHFFTREHLLQVTATLQNRFNHIKDLYHRLEEHPSIDDVKTFIDETALTWKTVCDTLGYTTADRSVLDLKQQRENPGTVADTVLNLFDEHTSLDTVRRQLQQLHCLATADVFWDQIQSIEPVPYTGYVYDVTVTGTHNFIAGSAGGIISHNSYTLGVLAEELQNCEEIQDNISVIIVDSMGIYWSMKYANSGDAELLSDWDLRPEAVDMDLFVPEGMAEDLQEQNVPFDQTFSLRPSMLTTTDWRLAFGFERNEPEGVLLERVIAEASDEHENYSVADLITITESFTEFDETTRQSLVNRFNGAQRWGLFSTDGTDIDRLTKRGNITVLDISQFGEMAAGWSIRSLVVGLLARKLLRMRMEAKRLEELEEMEGKQTSEEPIIWMLIDEAHTFLPNEGETPATGPLLDWVKLGREPGVSLALATQQPYKLHPDALSQVDLLLSHRLTAQNDIEALKNIMQTYMRYDLSEYIDALPREKGAAIILDDNSERIYSMQVRPRHSWHAGGTPTALKEGRT